MARARERWARVAGGWGAHADHLRDDTMPISAWMVDALEPQPGQTVLELAAGPGDTGFLAAELLQPGGTLISSDFSPEMLSVAQERAAQLGIRNVRFRQIDMQLPLDQPAASLDGVLCRWGFQTLADPEPAFQEARRVLRPGARLVLAAPAENLASSLVTDVLVGLGAADPPQPDSPGQFGFAREGRIAELLDAAGFAEHLVDRVPFSERHASVADWWETEHAMSGGARDAATRVEAGRILAALREAAVPYVQPDGTLGFPAVSWVAAATA
jgi:SAM-dependent methyltransferase